MTDSCITLERLLALGDLRARTYTVHERHGAAAVNTSGRSGSDWFFARAWVEGPGYRRSLYRLLDRVEAAGFRFEAQTRAKQVNPTVAGSPWNPSALAAHKALSTEGHGIHREVFPDEMKLLDAGYDWNAQGVSLHGLPFPTDHLGRVLERTPQGIFEWVRIDDEWTWRRYPVSIPDTTPCDPSMGPALDPDGPQAQSGTAGGL